MRRLLARQPRSPRLLGHKCNPRSGGTLWQGTRTCWETSSSIEGGAIRRAGIFALALASFVPIAPTSAQQLDTRSYDEILLAVCERVPEFAGVIGGLPTLKILVTSRRPGLLEELVTALDAEFGELPGGGRQYEDYTEFVLVDAEYSWCQLMEWSRLLIFESKMTAGLGLGWDIDDLTNRLEISVDFPLTQAEIVRSEAARLGIPNDALTITRTQIACPVSSGDPCDRESAPIPWLPLSTAAGVVGLAMTIRTAKKGAA